MQNDHLIQVPAELTEREQEILRLIATGTSNKDIARRLFISSNTVKVHLRNIFAKIGVASRTEAAMYAVRTGLVKSPAPSEQNDGNPAQETTLIPEFQTIPGDSIRRPLVSFRPVRVAVIAAILLVVVGIGFILARPKSSPTTRTSQTTPTIESRWHILAALPTARSGLAVTTFENQVFAIGGDSLQGVTGVVERYDPATDSWAGLSQKPVPVSDVNAAVIGGRIYVPGGRVSSGGVIDTLEIYDPRQNTWSKGNNLPLALSAYAMTEFEGRLYLFGGWDGKKYLSSVYSYDPGQEKWSVLASMPEERGFASAAAVGDKIYVIGGFDGNQPLTVNDVYTPHLEGLTDSWGQAKVMPASCKACGIASASDNIYIIGGQETSKAFYTFLPKINQWQMIDAPPLEIGEGSRLAQLGELILVIGGQVNKVPTGHNLAYRALYTVQIQVIINK
jgi:DNA-binding CsgD family transcriptional regulator